MTAPVESIQQLEQIEQQIASAMQSAGQSLVEMSKDKPSAKQVEGHVANFLKTLENMEKELSTQLIYLLRCSTGQPHEGSCYAAHKDLKMAQFRIQHVRSRLAELDSLKNEHLRQHQQQAMQRTMSHTESLQASARAATLEAGQAQAQAQAMQHSMSDQPTAMDTGT